METRPTLLDGELLAKFAAHKDEAAFAELGAATLPATFVAP